VKPYLWTLEELLDIAPPESADAMEMMAPADVLRDCNSLEECLLPLVFNTLVLNKNSKFNTQEKKDDLLFKMVDALLENRVLDDEKMVILIDRLIKNGLHVSDWGTVQFLNDHNDYRMSRRALISVSRENNCSDWLRNILRMFWKVCASFPSSKQRG
jgi:hypothetical protein